MSTSTELCERPLSKWKANFEKSLELVIKALCDEDSDERFSESQSVDQLNSGMFSDLSFDIMAIIVAALMDLKDIAPNLVGVHGHVLLSDTAKDLCHLSQTCRVWNILLFQKEVIWVAEAHARLAAASIPSYHRLVSLPFPFIEQLKIEETIHRQFHMFKEAGKAMTLNCSNHNYDPVRESLNSRWRELYEQCPTRFCDILSTEASKPPGLTVLWRRRVACLSSSSDIGCAILYFNTNYVSGNAVSSDAYCSILVPSYDNKGTPNPWHPDTDMHEQSKVHIPTLEEGYEWTCSGIMMSKCGRFVVVPQNSDDRRNDQMEPVRETRFMLWDRNVDNGGFREILWTGISCGAPRDVNLISMVEKDSTTYLVAYMDDFNGEGGWVRVFINIGNGCYEYGESNLSYFDDGTEENPDSRYLLYSCTYALTLDGRHCAVAYVKRIDGDSSSEHQYRFMVVEMSTGNVHLLAPSTLSYDMYSSYEHVDMRPSIEVSPNADIIITEYDWNVRILRRIAKESYNYECFQTIRLQEPINDMGTRYLPYEASTSFWSMSPCGSIAVCSFIVRSSSKASRIIFEVNLHGCMDDIAKQAETTCTILHSPGNDLYNLSFQDWQPNGLVIRTAAGCLFLQ